MDKYIFDESNGLWYERQGDYYIPCLTLPAEDERPIGLWGQRHLQYIKKHRKTLYTSLRLSGELNSYLTDIDQQAQEMLDTIIEQVAQAQGVTEVLKATDQMRPVSSQAISVEPEPRKGSRTMQLVMVGF